MLIWGGGGVFTKLKQCKQTTGPKSVVPGAEMHRTGGRNPSYHVIISNISHTLVGTKIVDHSDVVEASHVGTAPTTSSFST